MRGLFSRLGTSFGRPTKSAEVETDLNPSPSDPVPPSESRPRPPAATTDQPEPAAQRRAAAIEAQGGEEEAGDNGEPNFEAAEIAIEDGTFVDNSRGRSVPWRLYFPRQATTAPAPVVIFSHGLGGSREAAPYLGQALAEGGYWGLFIQHQGSDIRLVESASGPEEVRSLLLKSLHDPSNMVNRFLDVPFVMDELERLNWEQGSYQDRFDLKRIGIAGHSYGARTVLAVAGQAIGPMNASYKDTRIRAAVALSPSGGRGMNDSEVVPPEAYSAIDIPILHITGTEDRLPLGGGEDFDPYIRTLPFQYIPNDDQYLIVLHGAEHDDFSSTRQGRRVSGNRYTMLTAEASLLFFDAYLRDSESAGINLRNHLAEHLDREDYYEFR